MEKYADFEALRAEQSEERDFRIRFALREGAKIALVAPHGGEIEPGTSELAIAIAGAELSFAVFEGIKERQNRDLHITSTNFNEPRCVHVVAQALTAVAIHGENSQELIAFIGGGDAILCNHISDALINAGFSAQEHRDPRLQGKSLKNICNRGLNGRGVQLELSLGLRSTFFESLKTKGRMHPTQTFHQFVGAVRQGLIRAGAL